MLLSARLLKDVASVNSFEPDTQVSWTEGDQVDLYFQLVDMSLDKADQGFSPAGRRYVPAGGSTLSVVLENIDDSKKITRTATQPFAQDGSIWKISILSTDALRGSPQMRLTLTESTKTTRGVVKCGLKIQPAANI